MEGGLDAQVIYDPPNLTYPYGAYIAVVDVDPDTAEVFVRASLRSTTAGVDQPDGGRRADPRWARRGGRIALMELISFDERATASTPRSWTT